MSFEEVLLEDLAAPQKNSIVGGPFGSNLVSRDYVQHGVPVIRGQNMGERWVSGDFVFVTEEKARSLAANKARPGDLVFTQRGTLGQVAIVPEGQYSEYIVSQSQMKLTPDSSKADVHYLYYAFRSNEQQEYIRNTAIQTGVPHTNLGILKRTPLKLPSLLDQRSIASVLRALDDRITLLRETNATLEAIAQALFKSWFVDFDPVRAKAEGRSPDGMDEATAALFPDGFEESELGLVPRGWMIGAISDLAKLNPESWTARNHPRVLAYVDLANTKENVITTVAEFDFDEAPSRARRVLRDGDTIVGTVRPGNRSFAFIREPEANLTGSTGFAVLRPIESRYAEFVYLVATQDSSIEYLTHLADGAAYPAVRPDVVGAIQTCIPPDGVLESFHEVAAPLFAKVAHNQRQAQTIATLRDTLLPRLISGQLRLPEAEVESLEAIA